MLAAIETRIFCVVPRTLYIFLHIPKNKNHASRMVIAVHYSDSCFSHEALAIVHDNLVAKECLCSRNGPPVTSRSVAWPPRQWRRMRTYKRSRRLATRPRHNQREDCRRRRHWGMRSNDKGKRCVFRTQSQYVKPDRRARLCHHGRETHKDTPGFLTKDGSRVDRTDQDTILYVRDEKSI